MQKKYTGTTTTKSLENFNYFQTMAPSSIIPKFTTQKSVKTNSGYVCPPILQPIFTQTSQAI